MQNCLNSTYSSIIFYIIPKIEPEFLFNKFNKKILNTETSLVEITPYYEDTACLLSDKNVFEVNSNL